MLILFFSFTSLHLDFGGRRGNRTLTPLLELDFESGASTNSAIRPYLLFYHKTPIYVILFVWIHKKVGSTNIVLTCSARQRLRLPEKRSSRPMLMLPKNLLKTILTTLPRWRKKRSILPSIPNPGKDIILLGKIIIRNTTANTIPVLPKIISKKNA